MNEAARPESFTWSEVPACHERHLQRRLGNPLFPPDRRAVTPAEFDTARSTDLQDTAQLVQSALMVAQDFSQLGDSVEMKDLVELRERTEKLVRRSQEVGGQAVTATYTLLTRIRDAIVEACRGALKDDNEAMAALEAAEQNYSKWRERLGHGIWAQIARQDTPIRQDEIPATVLSESVDDIRSLLLAADENVRTVVQTSVQTMKEWLHHERDLIDSSLAKLEAIEAVQKG